MKYSLIASGGLALLPLSLALSYQEDQELLHSGRPQIKLWQAIHNHRQSTLQSYPSLFTGLDAQSQSQQVFTTDRRTKGTPDPEESNLKYEAHCFYQPLDHYDPDNNVTLCQRYWISTEHWDSKEGAAPIYVLDGGETSGANRLPFLETGILNILSNVTGGIGIVLEHRYYGKSLPNVSYPSGEPFTLSTDDLRFLTSEQALMDSVRLVQGLDLSFVDKRLSRKHISSEVRPWIWYGGSYAGAMTAFLVKGWGKNGDMISKTPPPHPSIQALNARNLDTGSDFTIPPLTSAGLVWGGIASSAVTHAQTSYPEYFQAIQAWAPEKCMRTLEDSIETIDYLLELQGGKFRGMVQGLFGLEGLEHVEDFGEVLGSVLGSWQARNWDPAVGSSEFYRFCDILTAGAASPIADQILTIGPLRIPTAILNYAGYVKEKVVARCPVGEDGKRDIEACFGTFDPEPYKQTGLDQKWRLWLFQVCENWGYFMPAPLEGKRIISKFLDLNYTSKTCAMAYPDGNYFSLPEFGKPDVERVNARGDFALAADMIAYIDGDSDPWRPATPQSDYAEKRNSTLTRPVYMIEDSVHHFDENGLYDSSKEPKRIQDIHAKEIVFVKEWLRQWKEEKKRN